MNMLFIIGSRKYSGAEKVFSSIIDKLNNGTHKINVILLEENTQSYEENGINFYGAKVTNKSRLFRIYTRIMKIRSLIKKIRPDMIISFGNVSNVNVAFANLNLKYPLIVCERNDPIHDPVKSRRRCLRNFSYKFAEGFVFQTTSIQRYFNKKIQSKSAVIENPVIQNSIIDRIPSKKNQIILVARLDNHQKRITRLIKSFDNISNNIPSDYKLVIIGDGPDKMLIQNLIDELNLHDRIILKGKVNNVIEHLLESKIFVLTSLYEGMPNALIEAMSAGLPSVVLNFSGGGAEQLINNNINGIITDGFLDFEKELSLLINDEKRQVDIGYKAKEINRTNNLDMIVNEWEKYINKIYERYKNEKK